MGRRRLLRPAVENLEIRLVLSETPQLNLTIFHHPSRNLSGETAGSGGILPMGGLTFPIGYSPQQIATAYGIDKIEFGSVTGDGTGQTIAIVDAYDDPAFVNEYLPPTAPGGQPTLNPKFANSDLGQFDSQLGIADPPNFTKVNESGQTSPLPGTDPAGAGNVNGNWEIEEALDIEWAHAIAPGANIVLVEATTDSNADLFKTVQTAASLPGVSAVSMSWGLNEYNGEQSLDSTFVTPAGHQGVTFVAASGDSGGFAPNNLGEPTTTPGVLYPAASPDVVGVGGTTLNLNPDDSYSSETAWSLSGGGTSLYEPKPGFQAGVQATNFRTIPDVAFDADPSTGVSVYDSYNDTDNSGPWIAVGGTSLAAPAWAGLIAIANQGRVLAGGTTLDGRSQTLPALYAISPTDFNDITSGSNGVFSAGIGYDEVTGMGSPKADLLVADLAAYGTAKQVGVIAQPPASVIAEDSFGVVVAAENPAGGVDPAFSGKVTIALGANPGHSTLGGILTQTAYHGIAVFDGLTLNNPGNGYTLQITSSFPTISTTTFNVTSNTTPWEGTFYPAPTDASLRAAISAADSDAYADNTILLETSTYLLSNAALGEVVISNSSSLPAKTLTIAGQGPANSIIASGLDWTSRIFEIEGASGKAVSVVLQGLAIEGGHAQNAGAVGGNVALGGGLLIENAAVTLENVLLENNTAQGVHGRSGAAGHSGGGAGGPGGAGAGAKGGGIYLASGTLSLFDDTFSHNNVRGGQGGAGGKGGGQGPKGAAGVTGGPGGTGGNGGNAAGGAVYVAGGNVVVANVMLSSNEAVGGPGGQGGSGGSGGRGVPQETPPIAGKRGGIGGPGGVGGAAQGGAIYLAAGSVSVTFSTLQKNEAIGGAGGLGGTGGPGTAEVGGTTNVFGGSGSFPGLTGLTGLVGRGGPGGTGGSGGVGGVAGGGGAFVSGGALTVVSTTLTQNQAIGGQGGLGGHGGTAGFGGSLSGLPIGDAAGPGGTGGDAGSGYGGGINVFSGALVLLADTLSANVALGGNGGTGGQGGSGPIAVLFGGSGIVTGTGGGGGGTGGTGGGGGGGGGSAINTAGPGGDGGNGAIGNGGGLYVSGGTLVLTNDTIAGDSATAGGTGSGGQGGHAGTGKLTGGYGNDGAPGSSFGGGLFVDGGAINLFNSTVALNTQSGDGSGGGIVEAAGTVTAVSTLVGDNGSVDFSGDVTATDSLFQTAPTGTLSGSGNLVGVDPLLNSNGLQNNGGPTQTIALQPSSSAIGAGSNVKNLLADQRGFAPRTGPHGTDIGAYQHDAQSDAQAPSASLHAVSVTSANASSLNPYTFTITFTDDVAIAAASLSSAVVEVVSPGGLAPITATVVSTVAGGKTDASGDAQSFVVTYQITPPGGSWTFSDDGTYTVTLEGAPVTDLGGDPMPLGSVGTFTVTANGTEVSVSSSQPNSTYGETGSFTATVTSSGAPATGTVQFVVDGADLGGAIKLSGGTATSPSTLLGAGSHTVVADYSGDSHYKANTGSYTQVVNQAPLSIVPQNLSRAVGQMNPTLTWTLSGFVNGENATSAKVAGAPHLATTAVLNSPAGNYPITVTDAGNLSAPNYDFPSADYETGTLTVSTGTATVGVSSSQPNSTYGQSVSFTVTVSGGGPTPTGTVQFVVDGTDLGGAITLSAGTATSPTTTLLGAGNNTVVADYSGDPNYAATSGSYTQVVTAAPLSIIPDNLSRAVGQTNPALTYTFSGFVNGENATTAKITGAADLSTMATMKSPIGQYPITVTDAGTLSAPNYDFPAADFKAGTLTVTAGTATVGVSSSQPNSTYGPMLTFTVTVSGGGPTPTGTVQFMVDGTDLGSAITLSAGSATSTSLLLGAGNHTVVAGYSGDPNYEANSGSYTQVVNPAPLSIVPQNQSREVGQQNPTLTYTLSGFVNGENATTANVTGAPDLATTAMTNSPAGQYPITVTGAGALSAPNYDFPAADFETGMLTVTAGAATVGVSSSQPNSTYGQSVSFTVTVGGAGPKPTGTVQFVVDGTDLGGAITLSGGSATSPSTTLLGAGNHTVVVDYSGDPNYMNNTGSYTQIVKQATLTLVADNQQMNHYAAVPTLTYHYSGFVNGDTATTAGITATVSLSTTATPASHAGYYPITASVTSFTAPNYVLGGVSNGSLTVKPKVMAIRVDYGKTSMSLLGLKRDLPYINIQAIDVVFSDNVTVSSTMLQLLGINVKRYSFNHFGYNSKTFDATWTLPSAIGVDRLMLNLTGETAKPASGSGPNIAADAFGNSFAVLPGDVNGVGVVTMADLNTVANDMRNHKYSIWADVDANGVVNQIDYNNVKKRLGNKLP
jgi:hypothetical protein